jgi:class 3 adenylate cyclase
MYANHSRFEAWLGNATFQRAFATTSAAFGVACAAAVVTSHIAGTPLPNALGKAPIAVAMAWLEHAMRVLLVFAGGALGLYLSLRGSRRPLSRMLASSCAAISAGFGLVLVAKLAATFVANRFGLGPPVLASFTAAFLFAVGMMTVWMFATAKFFLFFPKPVRILDVDPMEPKPRVRLEFSWRWLLSPQFAALVAGMVLIAMVDAQAGRLESGRWMDVNSWFICWIPFAAISAKQRKLEDEDRRSIRWVVLGQSIWLAFFLAAMMALLLLRSSGVVALPGWTDSEQFTSAFFGFFFAGFVIVLMATLAFSIMYHGTLDPGLMIRRTWVLAAIGLSSGVLFVLLERFIAGYVAGWLGVSAVNALTIVAAITAVIIFPLRAWFESTVKDLAERWNAANAIVEGVRGDAVIVFADLTGYTALTEKSEREALIMAAIFHRDAQDLARKYRGSLIKTIGDAVMLRFAEVDAAYAALGELKANFRAHVQAMSMEPLLIHAAIHRGEVVEAPSGDVFGATVNLAARLLGAAGADDIVASQAAVEQSTLALRAQSLGQKQFKNVTDPVGCYRLA